MVHRISWNQSEVSFPFYPKNLWSKPRSYNGPWSELVVKYWKSIGKINLNAVIKRRPKKLFKFKMMTRRNEIQTIKLLKTPTWSNSKHLRRPVMPMRSAVGDKSAKPSKTQYSRASCHWRRVPFEWRSEWKQKRSVTCRRLAPSIFRIDPIPRHSFGRAPAIRSPCIGNRYALELLLLFLRVLSSHHFFNLVLLGLPRQQSWHRN